MYKIITFILLFFSVSAYGQFLSGVKHVEIISEIKDSMVLLNKPDVDKINKTYFEKNKLDSLNVCYEKTILLLEQKIQLQDSLLVNHEFLLNNEIATNMYLKKNLEDNMLQYEKYLRKEKIGKIGWQTATGAAIVGVILALILK